MRRSLLILMLLLTGSAFAQYTDTSDVIRGILGDAQRNLKEKRYTMAQYYCDKGLEIQPYNEDLLMLKGDAFYQADKYEDAVKIYSRIITVKGPKAGKPRYARAMADYMLMRYRETISDLMSFQEKDTLWSLSGYVTFFECYRFLHKADSAAWVLKKIEKKFPGEVYITKYRADLFAVKHQYDSASKYYYVYDSLASEPDYYAYRDHVKVLIKMEEFDKARQLLKKIFDAYPDQYQCQLLRGECLLHDKNFEEFQKLLTHLNGQRPDDPEVYLLMAKANYYGMDNKETALNYLDECLKRGGDKNPEFWFTRGSVKAEQKFYADAEKDFEEAIRLDPYYTEALCESGNCFFYSKLYDDALNCFGRALKINPQAAASYESRGYYYLKMNKISKARADFEKALSLKPGNPQYYLDVAIADVFVKSYDKAIVKINYALPLALQKDSALYNGALFFKWTTFMLAVKIDSALQCINNIKSADARDAYGINYMKLMTYFAGKKLEKVDEIFNSMDTSVTYHMIEYVNISQQACLAKNDIKGWVKVTEDFFVRNASNYYLLDNVITYNEENSEKFLQHEQIDLGNDFILFRNVDSAMGISITVGTKSIKERQQKILQELDHQISKSKHPAVLFLIKARYLTYINDKTALDAFNKAIETDPEYKTAYYFRGLYKKKKLKDEKGGEEDLARAK